MTTSTVRTQIHGMWAAVAPAWVRNADFIQAMTAPVTNAMLDAAILRPGLDILELACGAGDVGLTAARRLGGDCTLVLSDVVEEMTTGAAARARAAGLDAVRTAVRDIEDIAEPDSSFDLVVCREGLMFATEPARALAEIVRVLRPGGSAVIAVWGPRAENPRLSLMFDAVGRQLGMQMPPPGVPGPFALDDRARLTALLGDAGFVDVTVDEHRQQMRAGSFDEWIERTTTMAGPLARRLASMTDQARSSMRIDLQQAAQPYVTSAGLDFPSVTLVARGVRPST